MMTKMIIDELLKTKSKTRKQYNNLHKKYDFDNNFQLS